VKHIGSLVDVRVVVVALVLAVVCGLAARPVARKTGATKRSSFVALSALALIAALTLANRGVVVSRNRVVTQLTWWTEGWGHLPSNIGDLGWWMNVLLFVPAGALWTFVTGKAAPTVVSLAIASFVIETAHATVLSGIGDPADLVANMAGAGLGSPAGCAIARRIGAIARQA
jgi:VanZ like family